jgi:protein-disulfide isomerase
MIARFAAPGTPREVALEDRRMLRSAAVSLAVLALTLTACSETKQAGDAASASPDDTVVAGRIAGEKVTVGEIDAWIKDQLFNQTTRGRNALKVYEVRNRALEQMASERALEQEATKAGKDRETLLKDEVQKYYDENKERFRNMPFEKVSPAVKRQLLAQRQVAAMQEYVGGLRTTLGYENQLQPPRFEIAVGASPTQGPADAPITLVEFSDYECPFCKAAAPILKQVQERYPTQVRRVTKNFPIESHPKAKPAAEAAMCALEQGKFWEYDQKLFEKAPQIGVEQLAPIAAEAGLDKAKFEECLNSHRTAAAVQADVDAGKKAGVAGTPSFFVNGVPIAGGRTLNDFAKAIDAELERLKLPVPPPLPPAPPPTARMMPPGHPGPPQVAVPSPGPKPSPAPAPK